MTLLIACLLISGFDMDSGWYTVAVVVWLFHLSAHNNNNK